MIKDAIFDPAIPIIDADHHLSPAVERVHALGAAVFAK
jgi:hypothetical protein